MITNKHSFFAIMIALIGTFDIMFFKGFLSVDLEKKGFVDNAGLIMALPAFVYLVACLLLPYTCEHSSRKFLFFLSMIGFAGCIALLGPSEILNLPDNVWLIISS
jgi:MFS family permease